MLNLWDTTKSLDLCDMWFCWMRKVCLIALKGTVYLCLQVSNSSQFNEAFCLTDIYVCYYRYKEGHAIRHWKDTQHCYSLDLETQRVWDYVGDRYVHRLNQSRSDDKLAKLKSNSRYVGENCINCECSDDLGSSGAILNSKVDVVRICKIHFYISP